MVIYQTNLPKDKLSVLYLGYILYFGGHFGKSALTPSPRVGIFADNLISIGLCIRFPKMFVCENPPGGAWGVRLACRLHVPMVTRKICKRRIYLEMELFFMEILLNARSSLLTYIPSFKICQLDQLNPKFYHFCHKNCCPDI